MFLPAAAGNRILGAGNPAPIFKDIGVFLRCGRLGAAGGYGRGVLSGHGLGKTVFGPGTAGHIVLGNGGVLG